MVGRFTMFSNIVTNASGSTMTLQAYHYGDLQVQRSWSPWGMEASGYAGNRPPSRRRLPPQPGATGASPFAATQGGGHLAVPIQP